MPVSLQHIGGELFRVTTDGNPSVSPFYNLIKAIESAPGLYEVVDAKGTSYLYFICISPSYFVFCLATYTGTP